MNNTNNKKSSSTFRGCHISQADSKLRLQASTTLGVVVPGAAAAAGDEVASIPVHYIEHVRSKRPNAVFMSSVGILATGAAPGVYLRADSANSKSFKRATLDLERNWKAVVDAYRRASRTLLLGDSSDDDDESDGVAIDDDDDGSEFEVEDQMDEEAEDEDSDEYRDGDGDESDDNGEDRQQLVADDDDDDDDDDDAPSKRTSKKSTASKKKKAASTATSTTTTTKTKKTTTTTATTSTSTMKTASISRKTTAQSSRGKSASSSSESLKQDKRPPKPGDPLHLCYTGAMVGDWLEFVLGGEGTKGVVLEVVEGQVYRSRRAIERCLREVAYLERLRRCGASGLVTGGSADEVRRALQAELDENRCTPEENQPPGKQCDCFLESGRKTFKSCAHEPTARFRIINPGPLVAQATESGSECERRMNEMIERVESVSWKDIYSLIGIHKYTLRSGCAVVSKGVRSVQPELLAQQQQRDPHLCVLRLATDQCRAIANTWSADELRGTNERIYLLEGDGTPTLGVLTACHPSRLTVDEVKELLLHVAIEYYRAEFAEQHSDDTVRSYVEQSLAFLARFSIGGLARDGSYSIGTCKRRRPWTRAVHRSSDRCSSHLAPSFRRTCSTPPPWR